MSLRTKSSTHSTGIEKVRAISLVVTPTSQRSRICCRIRAGTAAGSAYCASTHVKNFEVMPREYHEGYLPASRFATASLIPSLMTDMLYAAISGAASYRCASPNSTTKLSNTC